MARLTGLDAARVRANADRVREEIAAAARRAGRDPPTSSCSPRSSTSPLEELGALAEAGLDAARREPRPGARGQGRRLARRRLPLALHRPAPEPQGQADPAARRADPLGRVGLRAAPARAPRHAGDRDPGRGQRRRGGGQGRDRARRARRASSRAAPVRVVGPDDDAAVRRGSGGQPAALRRAARARRRARPARALDGHLAGLSRSPSRKARRSCGSARYSSSRLRPGRETPCWHANDRTAMAFSRHLAPHARLLRPRRGPRRVRREEEQPADDPRARGGARGPLPRAPQRPPPLHAPAPRRDRRHLRRRLARPSGARRVLRPVGGRGPPTAAAGRCACTS